MVIDRISPKQGEVLSFIVEPEHMLICSGSVRSGRPKNINLLREIFEARANNNIADFMRPDTNCIEAIADDWLNSSDYKKQRAALEIIFGKLEHEEEKEPGEPEEPE